MDDRETLADTLEEIGFQCLQCGTCCTALEKDSNLVMVTPDEIRDIASISGLSWGEIVEPYPEWIRDAEGRIYTFGWCLRRRGRICSFLQNNSCLIYQKRPWICRTFPFVLFGKTVDTAPCPGLGKPVVRKSAQDLADHLILRKHCEEMDEASVRRVFRFHKIHPGVRVVIDNEGITRVPE